MRPKQTFPLMRRCWRRLVRWAPELNWLAHWDRFLWLESRLAPWRPGLLRLRLHALRARLRRRLHASATDEVQLQLDAILRELRRLHLRLDEFEEMGTDRRLAGRPREGEAA